MDVNSIGNGIGFGIIGALATFLIIISLVFIVIYKNSVASFFGNFTYNITHFFGSLFSNNNPLAQSDVCSVIPGSTTPIQRMPSSYLAHIAFFVGFLLTNAAVVYAMPQDNMLSQSYYENRRNRSLMAIILLIIFYLGLVFYRSTTGCESVLGILFTSSAFLSLGLGWYKFAEACGARSADIFGIAPSIVSPLAAPLVCTTSKTS